MAATAATADMQQLSLVQRRVSADLQSSPVRVPLGLKSSPCRVMHLVRTSWLNAKLLATIRVLHAIGALKSWQEAGTMHSILTQLLR